jgi:ubiquitin-activating enzyme E1 C
MDTDDPEHIGWLYEVASKRAKEFKIEGVTWSLTQGVVKNIIPAIASTNAIIAGKLGSCTRGRALLNQLASCCNEAFKIATSSAAYLDNYFMLIGTDGVYSFTFQHQQRPDCPVCGGESLDIAISKEWTVDRLIETLVERQDMYGTHSPSLTAPR